MKVLFIHRSVGHNLIKEGGLRKLLEPHKIDLDDYDNNTGILTTSDRLVINNAINIPGNNTNPDNLASYFNQWDKQLDKYDLVMIKSCYPNSHIKNRAQLDAIKKSYTDILGVFRSHKKKLALLTSPPLRPLFTNQQEAKLANTLGEWLVSKEGKYVQVLNFHKLLSEESGCHNGMLRRDYRRLLFFDNHPNKKANRNLAPVVADFVFKTTR